MDVHGTLSFIFDIMDSRMTKFMISLICVAVRSLVGNVGVIVENVGQQFWSKCAGSVTASSVRPVYLSDECFTKMRLSEECQF